jgi:large subunit ribosomal protein L21
MSSSSPSASSSSPASGYAVIDDRGSQYTVKPGQKVRFDLRDGAPGDAVVFDRVLLVASAAGTVIGSPAVAGARVEGTVLRHGRAKKIVVFKKRRRKGYRRKQGHRQDFTEVRIDSVVG